MWESAITAYFHYFGFMIAFASLIVENLTFKEKLSLDESKRIVIADICYGLAAVIILVTGILRVLYFGKGSDYYLDNPVFYIKVGLYLLVGLVSLYPTITFILWVRDLQNNQVPTLGINQVNIISYILKFEIVGFSLLPLLAAILARGIEI